MARYFFHLNNGLTVEDVDGEEFDLATDARGHALKVAQESGRHGSSLGGRSISVTDEQGAVVFKRQSRTKIRPPQLAAPLRSNSFGAGSGQRRRRERPEPVGSHSEA